MPGTFDELWALMQAERAENVERRDSIQRNARESNLLGDLAFCPVCGDPRAARIRGDRYACRSCGREGRIEGWTR